MNKEISVWLRDNWRSLAFVVYFVICVFDFIIMPGIYELTNKHIDAQAIAALALQFKDPTVQIEIIKSFSIKRAWVPLTMDGAATFHLAFGALLTSAAYTRGKEKIEQIKKSVNRLSVDKPDA